MTKRRVLFIAVTAVCALLAITALMSLAQDNKAKPARPAFIPSPIFSPPYPPLPHHFKDVRTIQLLCQAPKGALKRAVMPPMEATGEADTFILLLGWTQDVEEAGFNVHEIAINAPVKWSDKTGNTTLIEYIDSDMGLIAGREIYGWPKKMADITWSQTSTGCSDLARRSYAARGVAFRVLEGGGKGFQLGVGHSERTALGAPASHYLFDLCHDVLGTSP